MASRLDSTLHVWRIADGRYPLFDGAGAARFGARWNSPGRFVIYGALTYAGALLERLAQAGTGRVPRRLRWIEITVPRGASVEKVEPDDVALWDAEDCRASRAFGDRWYDAKRSLLLIVPSVVGRPHERNVAINQNHPQFRRVRAGVAQPVAWDARLLRR